MKTSLITALILISNIIFATNYPDQRIIDSLLVLQENLLNSKDFKNSYLVLEQVKEREKSAFLLTRDERIDNLNLEFKLSEEEQMIDLGYVIMQETKLELNEWKLKEFKSYLSIMLVLLVLTIIISIYLIQFKRNQLKQKQQSLLVRQLENRWAIKKEELENLSNFLIDQNDKQEIKSSLVLNFKENQNWLLLVNQFDLLFPKFRKNLLLLHQSLSESEIKLCYLIKLKLNNKEISESLFLTTQSVKINKNRLRKKLNIESVPDLINAIESL
jgi:DNA-binding CsgD family transcriptional regulator